MTDTGGRPPSTSRMGATSARGIALLVGAVLLGIVLLKATDPPDSLADASESTVPPVTTTSTTVTSTTEEAADEESTTTTEEEAAQEEGGALVLVANAANEAGVAGRLSQTLEEADFVVAAPANATVDVSTSTVYFAPGFEDAAADVAELFDPHPATAPLPETPPVAAGDLAGANVILVAGPDLAA